MTTRSSTTTTPPTTPESTTALPARPVAEEFSVLFDVHRPELRAHCYRMTGSLVDADDLTQETFLRAWRAIDRFERRASPRTWLYRIATNACLDFLKHHERRARPTGSISETLEREAWIAPYPDSGDPADTVVRGETTGLYLTAALLHLPPRQRAAVIARDVLELDAAEAAVILECSATAVHSLLQRAHSKLRELQVEPDDLVRPESKHDAEIVHAYIDAHRRGDVDAIVNLLDADVRITMPPEQPCIGRRNARQFYGSLLGDDGLGAWALVPIRANGAPAIANYVRRPAHSTFEAISIDVLQIERKRITAIHCFLDNNVFPAMGLASHLAPGER